MYACYLFSRNIFSTTSCFRSLILVHTFFHFSPTAAQLAGHRLGFDAKRPEVDAPEIHTAARLLSNCVIHTFRVSALHRNQFFFTFPVFSHSVLVFMVKLFVRLMRHWSSVAWFYFALTWFAAGFRSLSYLIRLISPNDVALFERSLKWIFTYLNSVTVRTARVENMNISLEAAVNLCRIPQQLRWYDVIRPSEYLCWVFCDECGSIRWFLGNIAPFHLAVADLMRFLLSTPLRKGVNSERRRRAQRNSFIRVAAADCQTPNMFIFTNILVHNRIRCGPKLSIDETTMQIALLAGYAICRGLPALLYYRKRILATQFLWII